MALLPRRALRSLLFLTTLLTLSLILLAVLLPYDHPWRLRALVGWSEASSHLSKPLAQQTWFFKHPKHPVDFDNDVGLIIKTSYGRGEHVSAQLQAMGYTGTEDGIVVVGDAEELFDVVGHSVQVVDVVGAMLADADIGDDMGDTPRATKYRELQEAIGIGQDAGARKLSESFGWHLDAMKFMPGLELAHQRAPGKKWWIIIDDDTLLLKASLSKLLARLDPTKDQYLGSAVMESGWEIRFAYGKAAIILSQRTLSNLFAHPDLVLGAKRSSLRETWGDQIIATALGKLGVYIDDRFTPFFHDSQPKYTRVDGENFCLPLVNFHGFGSAENLLTAGKELRQYGENKMIFNGAIWTILHQPDISVFAENPLRLKHDHVGRVDVSRAQDDDTSYLYTDVESALGCVSKCDEWDPCLAWTWTEETKDCSVATFVIVGDEAVGKISGMHYPRAKAVGDRCSEIMRKAGCFEHGAECGI